MLTGGRIVTDGHRRNPRGRSGCAWGLRGSPACVQAVCPHLRLRNAVICRVAPHYKKVKHQAGLIKSSLQETISISMPSFMQIH